MDNSAQGPNTTSVPPTYDQSVQPTQPEAPTVPQPTMTTPEPPAPPTPPPPPAMEPSAPAPMPPPPPEPTPPTTETPSSAMPPAPPPPVVSTPEPTPPPPPVADTPTPAAPTTTTSEVKPMETSSAMPPTTDPMKPVSENNQTPPPPPMHSGKHGHISPWTLALIVVLAGFAAFFLYIAFNPQFKLPFGQKKQESMAPTPTPVAFSTLALEEAPASAEASTKTKVTPASKTRTYNIVIDTHQNTVNAVQLELSYDPAVLTNVAIIPGTFFTTPLQLVKDIDTTNGRISYAVGTQPKDKGLQGKGILAQITFQINPAAKGPSTNITFLPKTLVAGQGINPSVLKSTTNATVMLVEPTPTTSEPAGAMKMDTTTTPSAEVTGTTKPINY